MHDHPSPVRTLAERLGCWEEISHFSGIQAIRYLQRREGYTDCFAREQPLVSFGYERNSLCAVSECIWKTECDRYRIPNQLSFGRGTASRDDILLHADRFDCQDEVRGLSEVEAIRYIQQKGGYTPCYATDPPLYPDEGASFTCANTTCYWKQACDGFRSNQVTPLAKAMSTADIETLSRFQQKISKLRAKLDQPGRHCVGMQLGSFNQLYPATKKMLIASPHTVVGEQPNTEILKAYLLQDRSRTVTGMSSGYVFDYDFDLFLTRDLTQLQEWLTEVQPFLDAGSLDYFPLIHNVRHTRHVSRGGIYTEGAIPSYWTLGQDLALETFKAPYLAVPSGEIMLTRSEFAPIINLDLPVLENIDMARLNQLMNDHPDELVSFRDYLMDKVDEMGQAAVGSEQFGRDLARLERDLRDRLRKLDSDYAKARLKTAFALSGLAVASWTLALFCVLKGTGDLLTVFGPGGVAITASAAVSDYLIERMKLKDEPVSFIWGIGKTERKK